MEEETENMVKIQAGCHNFYMDGYHKTNLDALKHSVTKNDFDGFIVYSGREGYGKSTFAMQDAVYLDQTFNLDRVVFSVEQFKEAVDKAEKYQAIVFDETMGYLSSRGAMSRFNRTLVKIFSEMRSKNLFVLLCITSFFELDRYASMHRSTGLIHVYKRGFFGSYDYNTKRNLYIKGKKTYSYSISPNFIGRFVKYFPLDKIQYETKKQTAIKEWDKMKERDRKVMDQRDKLMIHCINNKLLSVVEVSNLTELSLKQVYRILT